MKLKSILILHLLCASALAVDAAKKPSEAAKKSTNNDAALFPPMPPVKYLSPAEQLKHFQLPPGYRLELVLAEPDIAEPVAAVFDGNGRMFVAEMRSYMQNIDGKNGKTNNSRVSLHWSSKRNGKFDKHMVFADNLLLPRMLLPLDDGLLIGETDTNDIYLYRDTDGDGVSDKKELWFAGGKRGGNMEHQPSGLIWAMDNWLYTTYNAYRLRWTRGTNVLKEPTAPNGGQWGLTQDDFGKPWFVNAGGEKGPVNFQQHILYGAFNVRNQFSRDFMEVWPAIGLADVQGGEKRFRPGDKTLNHFTATCGAEIYRGDRLPKDLRGDLLFAEPVGRLIRRTKIETRDGITYLRNAYEQSEFIRSTDPNFRPVNMVNAPDGTLYIVDMYRGIIQEGNWVKEGSYLRKVVKQHSLDQNFGRGRVWRLVHKSASPSPTPQMLKDKPAKLVTHLEHSNGWWRDTAQKLLVLKGDATVTPALMKMALESKNQTARLHALWTLEGLDSLTPVLVRALLADANPTMRAQAIRASETLFKAGDKSFDQDVLTLTQDRDPSVAIQAMLTTKLLNFTNATTVIQAAALGTNSPPGFREIGMQLLAPPRSWGREYSAAEKNLLEKGDAIFKELCFACHNPDGKGTPVDGSPGVTLAPPIAGSRTINGHKDGVINVLLKGLAGPVAGKTYESQMVPMESNDDEWIAAIASFTRNAFGNKASMVTTNDVARVRTASQARTEPWTVEELRAALPQAPLGNRTKWKLTASHNTTALAKAVDGNTATRWDTKKAQEPGMWLQVELPQPVEIAGLLIDAGPSANDFPRGYKVELSNDGKKWGKPVAEGKGKNAVTEIEFKTAKTKFIRITQTGEMKGKFWSIHELDVLEPAREKVAVAKPTTKKKESFE